MLFLVALKIEKGIMSRFQINLKNINFKKGIFGLKIRNGQLILCRNNLLGFSGLFESFKNTHLGNVCIAFF